MTRLRSPARRAPQTIEAATELAATFAALAAELADAEAQREAELAKINAAADAVAVPLKARLKDIVGQLKPWFAANVDELTGGKKKSITLGGCVIGYRISPPKVAHTHGTDGAAVTVLRGTEYEARTVRVSYALNKPAILELIEAEAEGFAHGADTVGGVAADGETLEALGFTARQAEEFFVDRIGPKPETGATAEDADGEAVR